MDWNGSAEILSVNIVQTSITNTSHIVRKQFYVWHFDHTNLGHFMLKFSFHALGIPCLFLFSRFSIGSQYITFAHLTPTLCLNQSSQKKFCRDGGSLNVSFVRLTWVENKDFHPLILVPSLLDFLVCFSLKLLLLKRQFVNCTLFFMTALLR